MKKTQDQRFLEYAGIITSGKLQETEMSQTHARLVNQRHSQWVRQVKMLLAYCVCVQECGELRITVCHWWWSYFAVVSSTNRLTRLFSRVLKYWSDTGAINRLKTIIAILWNSSLSSYRVGGVRREEAETWREKTWWWHTRMRGNLSITNNNDCCSKYGTARKKMYVFSPKIAKITMKKSNRRRMSINGGRDWKIWRRFLIGQKIPVHIMLTKINLQLLTAANTVRNYS